MVCSAKVLMLSNIRRCMMKWGSSNTRAGLPRRCARWAECPFEPIVPVVSHVDRRVGGQLAMESWRPRF